VEVKPRENFLCQKDIIPILPAFNKGALVRPDDILKSYRNRIGHNFGDVLVDGIAIGDWHLESSIEVAFGLLGTMTKMVLLILLKSLPQTK